MKIDYYAILILILTVIISGCTENKTQQVEQQSVQTNQPQESKEQSPEFKITDNDLTLADDSVVAKNKEWGGMNIPGPGGGYISWGLPQDKALPEDIFVYILIKYHHEKGIIPPASLVEKGMETTLLQYNLPKWKTSAIRSFWMDYATTYFKPSDVGGDKNIIDDFKWYLETKNVERGKKVNQFIEGFVQADEARQKAMSGWKKYDSQIQDREEQAKMERDANQVLNDAEWAIQKAAEAIEGKSI